ncbi:hypothetical protein BDW_06205 [Bdellovibrio bacteriovorus W]|nr:hypothetical protein BDW_06205 [Bdellovibrio bacteriovorus W]
MKKQTTNKALVMAVVLATGAYAEAQALNSIEVQSVRGVLRALNIDESQLSNQDIEQLKDQGNRLRFYEKSKAEYEQKLRDGTIYRTCGAGSHGGDGDPV